LFEEAEYDIVKESEHLRGVQWSWTSWYPLPALAYDPETGETYEGHWTHDYCHFCSEKFFGERDGLLREGWLYPDLPRPPGVPYYNVWVCPECFERLREHFEWTVW
jgi:hypothetical protein